MLTYWDVLNLVRDERKKNMLNTDYGVISLNLQPTDVKQRCEYVRQQMGEKIPLEWLLHLHYMTHGITYWQDFLKDNISMCHTVVYAYISKSKNSLIFQDYDQSNMFTLGLCFVVEQGSELYIRCLCSNSKCGGRVLQHTKGHYRTKNLKKPVFHRMKLHSEPQYDTISFYKKHGFITLKERMYDERGFRYPTMVCPLTDRHALTVLKTHETIDENDGVDTLYSISKQLLDTLDKLSWYISSFWCVAT